MRAVWYEATGKADEVLQTGVLQNPEARDGEVLVRLRASGVNPSDTKARSGVRGGPEFPRVIPHSDGAGEIVSVGPNVDRMVGERVWIWNGQWQRPFGTAAEYIAVPECQAVPLPVNVSFEVGAALGIPALTAAQCVLTDNTVRGQSVLVSGAAGTVGHLTVQMAKALGAARVIATARGEEGMGRARAAGADVVLTIGDDDLVRKVLESNDGQQVDRVIEVEFGVNVDVNAQVLKPRGRMVVFGSTIEPFPKIPFPRLLFGAITIEFVLVYRLSEAERDAAVHFVNDLLGSGGLDVPIHAVLPLDRCAEAHSIVESGHRTGAVVIALP